jgi:phage terminase small subunit
MELTEKQKRFIDYFIQTGNQTEAARLAGYKQPKVQGAQVYAKLRPFIEEQLAELRNNRIADAVEIMEYLTSVMRREHKEVIVVTVKSETTRYEPDENGVPRKKTIKSEEPQLVKVPAKLSDANKAAELLGKRYGMFSDRIDLSGEVGVVAPKLDEILEQLNE